MGQLLHGSARTTAAVRRAIQHSQESIAKLAKRYDVHPKTVAKWKKRSHVHDAPMGPKRCRSTVLTLEEEALLVAFRRHTLLPLDDCLHALQPTLPHLTRSALHRCLLRHGISRLPDIAGEKPGKKKFKAYPIGYFHIDIAEVRTEEGKLSLFVAIDRSCKFDYAELHAEANKVVAAQFLRKLLAAIPYKIRIVLTDHGIQFTNRKRDIYAFHRIFDRLCHEHGIDHRLTKTNHPWTNGQVERMNRTLKEATVKKCYYETHDHLKKHLHAFLMAYNFPKRLKTLKGLTSYEYICKCWQKEPERFTVNSCHHTLGLNSHQIGSDTDRRCSALSQVFTLLQTAIN
jgi:transposase InsO family protein